MSVWKHRIFKSLMLDAKDKDKVSIFINKKDDLDKVASILQEVCSANKNNFKLTSFNVELPDYFQALNIPMDHSDDYVTKEDCLYIDEFFFKKLVRQWSVDKDFSCGCFNEHKKSLLAKCNEYNLIVSGMVVLIKYIEVLHKIFIEYKPSKILIVEDEPCLVNLVKLFNKNYNFKFFKIDVNSNSVFLSKIKDSIRAIKAFLIDLGILCIDFFVSRYIFISKRFENKIIIDYRLYQKFAQTQLKEQFLICPFERGIKIRLKMLNERLFYLPLKSPSYFDYILRGRQASRVKKDWNKIKTNPEFRSIFKYKDIIFWDAIEEYIAWAFLISFPRIMTNINTFQKFAQKKKVKLIVMRNDAKELERSLIEAARPLGIPSLVIQHGIIGNLNVSDVLYADMTTVWGKATIDWFKRFGYQDERFVVTGNPMYDELYQRISPIHQEIRRKEVCEKLNLNSAKKIITFLTASNYLFGTSFAIANEMEVILRAILKALNALTDVHLIVKLHPYDPRQNIYRNIVGDFNLNNRVALIKDVNTFDTLEASDLVIMRCSSVGLEALILGKPLVSVMLFKGIFVIIPYAEDGAAIGVRKSEEIEAAIRNGLYNEEVRENLRIKRKEFVYNYAYKIDGEATKRTEELIYKLSDLGVS